MKAMLLRKTLFWIAFSLTLNTCAAFEPTPDLPTASSVDLARYVGTWHEIARLPMWAQRHCVHSTAEYWLLESGAVGVRNACDTDSDGHTSIEGVATIVDRESHAKLNVVFDQWAAKFVAWFRSSDRGNYWILRVDPDYRYALVGTPDREFLWILSRTPTLDEPTYQELLTLSQQLGFPTQDLIRSQK
jgi:apolipoprotein D and lipocalin family protein